MDRYRATRNFHIGALRVEIKKGDLVKVDGLTVTYKSKSAEVPGFDDLVGSGMLEPVDENFALVPGGHPLPAPVEEEEEPAPTWQEPSKKHKWGQDLFGSGGSTCSVCGVSLANPMSINLSQQSMTFLYTDAYGVKISSVTELPCPTFVGDFGGAIMGNTQRARKVTGLVHNMDERLAALEAENRTLEAQAQRRQDAALILLERLTIAAERLVELGDAQSGPALLADHGEILDAILVEPKDGREKVPVYAVPEEDEPWRKRG